MFREESVFLPKMLEVKWCLEKLLFFFFLFVEAICKIRNQGQFPGISKGPFQGKPDLSVLNISDPVIKLNHVTEDCS